jgi:ankyrin repeat protein
MKILRFAVSALALAALAAPASAQFGNATYDFIKAVKDRDGTKAMQALGDGSPGLLNARDGDGSTPLTIVIARQDAEWTPFLISRGADVNLGGKGGDTPLIAAARVGFEDAVDWLLEGGAKVDATNRMGETPLIVAVQQRDAQMVRQLLNAGADPDKTDNAAGLSARQYAARDSRSRQILQLIEAKKPKPAR